jgi:hypothetical protein
MDRAIRQQRSAGVLTLLRFQWRAFWRGFARGGKSTVGNQGLTLIIVVIVLLRYALMLRNAGTALARGKTGLLESLLVGIAFAWLVTTNGREQSSVATRRWLHLPLSLKELFAIRAVSLLIPPMAWLILLGSLAICYPLAHAPHPLMGMVAALLFITMSGFVGLTTAHLLSMSFWRKVLGAGALILLSGAVLYFLDNQPSSFLALLPLTRIAPTALVARAALGHQTGPAIVLLAIFNVMTFGAALWSFRKSLESARANTSEKTKHLAGLRIPGRLGGLIAKDTRYFWRLLDTYLGVLATAAGCLYLVTADSPALNIFLIFLTLIFVPLAPLAFNCFGLDTASGLDRYALFPLTGQAIMRSKNLAFLTVASLQASSLILLAFSQVGVFAGVVGLVAFTSLASASLTWGNWMSLSHPLKMQFFRFSSASASVFDALAGVVFSTSPGVLIIYLLHSEYYSVLNLALVWLSFACMYFFSLVRFGRRFEWKRETLARVLS